MTAIENMRRILTEAFSEGKLDVLDDLLHPDFMNHNAPPGVAPGIDGVKWGIEMERRGFPAMTYEVLQEAEVGDLVYQHALVRGTHLGPIVGVAPPVRALDSMCLQRDCVVDRRLMHT